MPQRLRTWRPAAVEAARKARPETKAERDKFYCGQAWRDLRAAKLAADPLCAECLRAGRHTAADTVHHVLERLIRPDLAYDWGNLESSCKPCHPRRHKTREGLKA